MGQSGRHYISKAPSSPLPPLPFFLLQYHLRLHLYTVNNMPLFSNNNDHSNAAVGSPTLSAHADEKRKNGNMVDDGNYPVLTFRTFFMAILVAMGGFVFGFDTGQISGFLEMKVFLEYFGELGPVSEAHPTGYYFTNVRSGLIVALV